MPPVFGPSSPSPSRLKSCAAPRLRTRAPSQSAKSETSGPSSSSSITRSPPNWRERAERRRRPRLRSWQTKTPLPGREPVGLDHARRPSRRGSDAAVGTPAASQDVLREALRPFDPRRGRARAEDGDPASPQDVGDAGDERRLRPDHDEIGAEREGEREQAVGVVGPDGMALPEPRDPRVAGRGVELAERRALRETPRERVLARARPDDQHLHARESTSVVPS